MCKMKNFVYLMKNKTKIRIKFKIDQGPAKIFYKMINKFLTNK